MTTPLDDAELDRRLRATLSALAATVTEESVAEKTPAGRSAARRRRRTRRRWGIGLGIGLAAVPVTLAAGAVLHQGGEYVVAIPPERIVVEGSVGGSDYVLFETDRVDSCGRRTAGVELMEKDENIVGDEWNTSGSTYGEPDDRGCYRMTERLLADPSLYTDGGTEVGDAFVWIWAVHPDVTEVHVSGGGRAEVLPVHRVDGAGYALAELPGSGSDLDVTLVVGGREVPGVDAED